MGQKHNSDSSLQSWPILVGWCCVLPYHLDWYCIGRYGIAVPSQLSANILTVVLGKVKISNSGASPRSCTSSGDAKKRYGMTLFMVHNWLNVAVIIA